MALNYAHEGYEYQDLLTVYFILKELIYDRNSKFIIDKKDNDKDKFDDLKIISKGLVQQKQIKYSNEDVDYPLSKMDLSSKGNHDIALDTLFLSWKEYQKNKSEKIKVETRLCLAWNVPEKDDEINDILKEQFDSTVDKTFVKTKIYKILLDILWPKNGNPLDSWRRFKKSSENFDRKEFEEFCNDLIIEINYPKASLNIFEPGELELEVIGLVKRLGVGKFPNETIRIEDEVLTLLHVVKKARSKGEELSTDEIVYRLRLKTNYGSISQRFRIDNNLNINLEDKYLSFYDLIKGEKKVFLYGEPGSGKSWFITNFQESLEQQGIHIIRHYCYTSLDDENSIKRIQTNVFYGNLISEILKIYNDLNKNNKYAADKDELETLLNQIEDELIIFIDGLDHISRVYELNKDKLKTDDINIIEAIESLNVKDNIKIVISSQPLSEMNEIEEKGFKLVKIDSWNKEEVNSLMLKFKVKDTLVSGESLSEILLKKSGGNPLYLTYLLSEVKNSDILIQDKLDKIPEYGGNLESYYDYIISKLNGEGECILRPLSGINFYVNRKELKEITGEGEFVDEAIEVLKPILEENLCSKGIMIYHESFRRYILDKYKEKGIDLKKKIYRDIIEWFEKSDFISSPKAYRNYLNILLDIHEYNKILEYLDKEFIVNSLFEGYSNELIKKNYSIFLKAATEISSFSDISLILQLGNQLETTKEEFVEINELYFKAVGYIYGFDRVNDLLSYEGEATLSQEDGLHVCYVCSINDVIPQWELYLQLESEEVGIDEFKYYIRYLLDLNDNDGLKYIIQNISSDEYNNFKDCFLNEVEKYGLYTEMKNFINELNIEAWNTYLIDYGNDEGVVDCGELDDLISNILSLDYVHEKNVEIINKFLLIIEKLLKDDKNYNIDKIIEKFQDINWFYNWIIYCIKVIYFNRDMSGKSDIDIDTELESIYSYLSFDTEVFKGKPRACDLYNIEEIIRGKIFAPLKYIKSENTWKVILDILTKVNRETTTSISGSKDGPLSTDKYVELLEGIANESNINIICDTIEEICKQEADYSYYAYLGHYKLECSILYARINKLEEAKIKLKEGIKDITSYTFRRDRTLSSLVDSIDVIYDIDGEVGRDKLIQLFNLAGKVVSHTDGKDTRYYPFECYNKLLRHNKIEALILLRNEMLKQPYYWINYECLEEFINEDSNEYSILKSYLYRKYDNRVTIEYLNGFIKNIKGLYDSNKQLAYVCYTYLINRLNLIKFEHGENSEVYREIMELSKLFDIEMNYSDIEYKLSKSIVKGSNRKIKFVDDSVQFSKLSLDKLIEYFKDNILKKEKINSFMYYFENLLDSFEDRKILIDQLVIDIMRTDEKEHFDNLEIAFENMRIDSDILSYFYTRLYCYKKDGNYNRFVHENLLIKAYKLNQNQTIKALNKIIYDIYKNIKYGSNSIANLLKGLFRINYDKNKILDSWQNMYDIIEYRLSGEQHIYSEDMFLDEFNMDMEEIIICIVMCLLNIEKVETEKLVIDCIHYYINHKSQKLYKPLKWLLKNNKMFAEMNLVVILQLIWENKCELNFLNELEEELKLLYSYNNFMITILINDILNGKEKSKDIVLNNKTTTKNDEKMQLCLSVNKNILFLESIGFGMYPVCKTFLYEMYDNGQGKIMCDRYFCRSYQYLIHNIFQENIFYKILNKNLLYAYYNKITYDYKKIFNKQLFDLNSIVAYINSQVIRPTKYKFPSEYEKKQEFLPVDINKEWIELAYYEREIMFSSDRKLLNNRCFTKAIIFDKDIDSPFNQLITKNIWDNIINRDDIDYNKLVFKEDSIYYFEDNKILWLDNKLLSLLELHLGECEEGLVAFNKEQEKVLIFNNWRANFIGNDDYNNYEIPKVIGQQLIMKKEYFQRICELMDKNPEYILIYS